MVSNLTTADSSSAVDLAARMPLETTIGPSYETVLKVTHRPPSGRVGPAQGASQAIVVPRASTQAMRKDLVTFKEQTVPTIRPTCASPPQLPFPLSFSLVR